VSLESEPVSGQRRWLIAVPAAFLFAFAFVAAPESCEWGMTAYFWSGVGAVVAMGVLPFVPIVGWPSVGRVCDGLLAGAGGIAVWFAGLFAADFQLLCRLF